MNGKTCSKVATQIEFYVIYLIKKSLDNNKWLKSWNWQMESSKAKGGYSVLSLIWNWITTTTISLASLDCFIPVSVVMVGWCITTHWGNSTNAVGGNCCCNDSRRLLQALRPDKKLRHKFSLDPWRATLQGLISCNLSESSWSSGLA